MMALTENEKKHMGATISTNKILNYPSFVLPAGSVGVIYDYGRTSGDPFVNFDGFECIVPWADLNVTCLRESDE